MRADREHVQHVQYFWGDPLTAAGAQSNDGKAALIQVYLAGDMGGSQANESVAAVRDVIADVLAPPGLKAYVSGPAAVFADEFAVGEGSHIKVTALTFRGDRGDAADRLPVVRHRSAHLAGGRDPGE